ncbi:MAG: twin-arginine translocase subunit TatC [Cyanobacteriota bacterium]
MPEEKTLPPESNDFEEKMTVIDHLSELRYRIFICLGAIGVCFIFGFIFSRELIDILKLISPESTEFVQISPGEVFIVSLKVSLYASIYFASPVIFYQIVKFLSPGLKPQEKKYVIPIVIAAFILFTAGILFAYYAALPLALNFLLAYGSDVAQNTISISKYITFVAAMILSLGLIFQVPLLILFLAFINIVNSKKLYKLWKYVILLAFIIGAIITPSPDPFAQSIVAGAIMALYGFSIALVKLIRK